MCLCWRQRKSWTCKNAWCILLIQYLILILSYCSWFFFSSWVTLKLEWTPSPYFWYSYNKGTFDKNMVTTPITKVVWSVFWEFIAVAKHLYYDNSHVTLKSLKKNMIRIKILSKDFPIKEHITARHFFLPQSGPKNCFSRKNTTIRSLWSNYNFVINSSIAIHICYLTSFCMGVSPITNNFIAIMTIVKIFFFLVCF